MIRSYRASAGHPEVGWFDAQGINEGNFAMCWGTTGGPEERTFIIMGDGGGARARRNSYYC